MQKMGRIILRKERKPACLLNTLASTNTDVGLNTINYLPVKHISKQ